MNKQDNPLECPSCQVNMQFVDIEEITLEGQAVAHEVWQCRGRCTDEDNKPARHLYQVPEFKLMPDCPVGGMEHHSDEFDPLGARSPAW